MKKLIVSMIVSAFMMMPALAMAQTTKPADKAKTEACCKKSEAEKKACCAAPEKKPCCKKGQEKACCAKKEAVKK